MWTVTRCQTQTDANKNIHYVTIFSLLLFFHAAYSVYDRPRGRQFVRKYRSHAQTAIIPKNTRRGWVESLCGWWLTSTLPCTHMWNLLLSRMASLCGGQWHRGVIIGTRTFSQPQPLLCHKSYFCYKSFFCSLGFISDIYFFVYANNEKNDDDDDVDSNYLPSHHAEV